MDAAGHGLGDPRVPPPRRGGGGVGLTVVAALVLAAMVAGVLFLTQNRSAPHGNGAGPPIASPTSPSATTSAVPDRQQSLDRLLRERSNAVMTRDRREWLSTVDPASTDFAAKQDKVFANLASVPLASWSYQLAGNGPTLSPQRLANLGVDEAWVARVVLEYRLEGSGTGPVRREQYLTLVPRGDRWLLADDTDGETSVDLWDLGPVNVRRGERSLLLGTADTATLRRMAREVDQASARVDTTWGTTWPRTVLVLVPEDQAQMASLLGRDDTKGLDQIAAVTTGEIGLDSSATSADRVIVNPDGFAQLGELGRDVVLTHELTHVATRATTTVAVPIWLSEGFADYVAYKSTGLSTRRVAKDVLDEVRRGDGPKQLPDAQDFDPALHDIAPAYAGAWLAVRMIADENGEDTLLRFYRAVAGGRGTGPQKAASTPGAPTASQTAVDSAFATVLHTTEEQFTSEWLEYLDRLAG
ncbi:MAG TPA: hypothetical protein VFX33_15520 [Actinomycetales bacterium]|nr:hypothetical protein [Actinomycetales bacterium]